MRLTRCFVPPPLRAGEERLLPPDAATHVARVLRARVGEALTLFDGRGGEYDARILQIDRHTVRVRVDVHRAIERESPLTVTLLQALARGERMDWIVQKATELGVAAIVPLRCERSVVRLDADAGPRRCDHWRTVAISACEQCGRNRLPSIHDVADVATACAQADSASLRLLLAPDAAATLAAAAAQAGRAASVTLLIGPEGGFSVNELELAQRSGFKECRLGPRVLRVETAPLAALASLQALSGDFRA